MPECLKDVWYDTAYWVSAFGATLGFSLRTEGMRYVPKEGPLLVIANHQSFLDPTLVGLAVRRRLCFLARSTLYANPAFGRVLRSLNSVPIDQEGFAREGLRTILEQLRAGRAVLVFPEGERTDDGLLHALRPGVHLLIKRVDMPILPVGIAGAYDAWPRWRTFPIPAPLILPPWKGTIAVSIRQPISSYRLQKSPRAKALQELFHSLHEAHQHAEKLRRK